ncbi:MAG: 30S ribosomal protein S20, partial [Candidatus Saccharimonadales bacterium]
ERNVATKRDIKTAVNAFIAKPTAKNLSAAYSELDTAVKKGLIKKNTAARRKMRLSKIAKNAGATVAAAPAKKAVVKKAAPAKAAAKKVAPKKAVVKKAPVKKAAAKKATK